MQEWPHFHAWLQETYYPRFLREYLDSKSVRDMKRWIAEGVELPKPPAIFKAANDACLRLTGRPALLEAPRRKAIIGPDQKGLFD